MIQSNIHFITGGQRSGKSVFAEQEALSKALIPTYLATSQIWDADLKKRIEIHKARRHELWATFEEEIFISKVESNSGVVLVECITQWLTNIYYSKKFDKVKTISFAKQEWGKLCNKGFELIVVSNENNQGRVPTNKIYRSLIDVQGAINQHIASMASRVTLVVSGIPILIKEA